MALGRYLVDAVVLDGRSPSELAKQHAVSRSWIYVLLARYRAGGYAAIEPRSRRPHSCRQATPRAVQVAILRLRRELSAAGHDAGPHSIAQYLRRRRRDVPSVATIGRILQRAGVITPQPQKRPRSSFIRFEAALPTELWQIDATHWTLAGGVAVEILDLIDDHSRLSPAAVAVPTVKAADVVAVFADAARRYGTPAAVLSDNAAVFSGESRRGKVLWESALERLGVRVVHSTPYHPQTAGKVERLHQTLKRYLARQPKARSIAMLQAQLDAFRAHYDQHRPHRALDGRTPLVAFHARVKAGPTAPATATVPFRVRQDRVDDSGRVSLRYLSRLRHIYVGRAHKRERIRLLIAGDQVRVVAETGELLRELRLDPTRNYQPRDATRTHLHNVLRQVSSMT